MIKTGIAFGSLIFASLFAQLAHAETGVQCSSKVPLPGDMAITPASGGLSPEFANFIGKWCGKLATGRDMIVVVENIDQTGRARVIYALSKGGRFNAFHQRATGSIENGTLQFSLRNTAQLKYKLIDENEIAGTWRRGDRSFSMTLQRAGPSTQSARVKTDGQKGSLPTEVRLSALKAPNSITAGEPYTVVLPFETKGGPEFGFNVRQACFYWSGQGPFCRSRVIMDITEKEFRVRLITRNPNFYQLKGYVEYESQGKRNRTNSVATSISVVN